MFITTRLLKRWLAFAVLQTVTAVALAAAPGWPGGAKVAVNLTFDVDGETLWWDDRETMQGRRGPLSQGVYGPTVALPKILALLERHDIRATFFVPSWIAETYPDEIREIVAGGHEIGAHGVRHVPPTALDPAEERRRLVESIKVLSGITGSHPMGYRAPAWELSDATLEIIRGARFLHSSNLMDADRPYVHTEPAGLVELPVSWVLDDAPHFWFDESSWNKTIRSAASVKALWQEEFRAAHAGDGYFGLTLHPQFIGRPARLRMLDELLGWMREFDGVWFATCAEVARHVTRTELLADPAGQ
ncbi:MAG: polysaccharide deacetylase [Woeseiaceae bacterium]|nr:polysaccharide deacetylase [Woeseiaceae bacterium]